MKKKTLLGIIGAILLAAVFIFCGVGSSWFTNGDIRTWFNGWGQSNGVEDGGEQSNTIITEGGSNGAALMCAAIPLSDYEVYELDEDEVESAFTLTIEVTPAEAVVTNFTWSVEFVNPNSTWASGKDINDYYTITPAEDNRSAVAACKQAFGEQLRIKAVYDGDTTIFATKMADYVKRIVGLNINDYSLYIYEPSSDGDLEPFNAFQPVYGVGTVQGTYKYENSVAYAWFELSDEAYTYLTSASSTSYPYMSNFLAANAGYSIQKQSEHKSFHYYADEGDWGTVYDCCGNDFISGYNWQTVKNYSSYVAALREMVEHTTNQMRVGIQLTYKYGDSFSKDITVYSDYGTTPASYIEVVNAIAIPESDLLH